MSHSTPRKEPENCVCFFRLTEIGKGDSAASMCFLVADVFPEQSHGISMSVSRASEAWTGELKGRDLELLLKASGYHSWKAFCQDTKAALTDLQDKSDYHITAETTMKARKPALRVSWSKTVRNKKEEIGTIVLSKSPVTASETKKFLKLAVARATKVSRRSVDLKVSIDALDAPFESAVEAAKQIVQERQREYISILSKTKLLLDAKSEFADSISSANNELDVSR
ncbi:hypothetical protein RvY_13681 [Ramazzottius varieornatus]|uniref:Uncharacterized protein n=1 Tax=Ramazzottius varieornatus TaxID=947166 RepID=A0A1D1VNR0_RAMVA|nr:hypothetical protein RvY_13681 [Ramazzottius varieornatus]